MNRFARRWGALAIVAGVALPAVLFGQLQIHVAPQPAIAPADESPADENTDDPRGSRIFAEDRTMTRRMRIAQRLLEEGQPAEGLELLQRILDHPEDFPFNPEEGDRSHFRSLKVEAASIIARLPAEQRQVYEQQTGSEARRMLAEAVATGNVRQLEEVARRFFHTQAGYEAADRLATMLLDRSEPLAAAFHFERLRRVPHAAQSREPMLSLKAALAWARAGFPQESRAALLDVKARARDGRIVVGERELPLFDDENEALAWLGQTLGVQPRRDMPAESEWPIFRGNPARTAEVASASPIWALRWEISTLERPRSWEYLRTADQRPDQAATDAFAEALAKQLEARRQNGQLLIPATHPLVVGDVVIYRTPGNLRAVDFTAGRRLWETEVDRDFHDVLAGKEVSQQVRQVYGNLMQEPRDAFLTQRAWNDLTAGTLASDGRMVYSVEGLGYVNGNLPVQLLGRQAGIVLPTKDYNKLVAHEATTGKLKWEIGGMPDGGLEAAGSFFLGPPLPMESRLYCLVQQRDEIRLLVLDAESKAADHTADAVLWSQLIAVSDAGVQHPLRRMSGVSPSYGDGVLVCPTGAGAVVAVDPGQQTLLWAYRYESLIPQTGGDINAMIIIQQRAIRGQGPSPAEEDESRWLDSVATIAEGKVLLAPRDSDHLHCLSLVDGRRLWQKPRRGGLYIAGVFEGKVIVVGRTQVEAYQLSDGSPAWDEPLPIPLPAGRGVRCDEFYRLPLSTGELATVDLRHGRIVARTPIPGGELPGNLIAARGAVISQTVDRVRRLESLEVQQAQIAELLTKNPDDPEALGLRGALALHSGDEQAGLKDLRRAVRGGGSPLARQLLAAILLEGLRHDFAAYRDSAEEIRALVDDPRQRSQFLRLHATGLQKIGEHEQAFREYLQMAAPETGPPEMEALDQSQSVRSDRWVRPRIAAVHAGASPEARARMNEMLAAELSKATDAPGTERLKRFLACFRDTPAADEARWELVERLPPGLEAELHLLKLRASADERTAGRASARLVAMLRGMDRPADALPLLDELQTRFADIVCLDGKTGRAIAEEWFADPQVAAAIADRSAWPARRIEAEVARRNPRGGLQNYPVEVEGPAGPFYEGWSFQLDQAQRHLTGYDPLGRKRWAAEIRISQQLVRNPYASFVRIHGHLIVLGFGSHFAVFDGLGGTEPRMLWHQPLHDRQQQPVHVNRAQLPGGGVRLVVHDQFGRPLGSLGQVGEDFICYQVGSTLTAADPLSGEPLWIRRNVPRGAELLGDDDFVLLVPQGSDRATIIRGSDGETIDERPIPPGKRLLASGRRLLVQRDAGDESKLSLVDSLSGEKAWTISMASSARVELVGGDELAVLEPIDPRSIRAGEAGAGDRPDEQAGRARLRIVSLDDGKLILDRPLEDHRGLASFQVLRSRERYVLLTYDPSLHQEADVQRIPIANNNPLVNGPCYAFDRRTGDLVWSRTIEHQALLPGQPAELPTLLLALRSYRRILQPAQRNQQPGANARLVTTNHSQMQILDLRTGETIVDEQSQIPLLTFELHSDPAAGRIRFEFSDLSVTLTFGGPLGKASGEPMPTGESDAP